MSVKYQEIQEDDNATDEIAALLVRSYRGDAVAALKAVIEDAAFLHDQLEIAACLIGKGLGRGWTPKFQRDH